VGGLSGTHFLESRLFGSSNAERQEQAKESMQEREQRQSRLYIQRYVDPLKKREELRPYVPG